MTTNGNGDELFVFPQIRNRLSEIYRLDSGMQMFFVNLYVSLFAERFQIA